MTQRTPRPAAAVVAATILAACAVREPPGDPELACRDRLVTVNHAAGYLAAHPEHLEVCAGRTVVINVVPRVETGRARTAPADELQPGWLTARNSGGRIAIVVPEDAAYGTYKYNIVIDGVGTLDPRLTVSRH
jgi:hypothetical protein